MKINNAIIFAAGMGTRMSPLTDYCPKPLIKINNKPLLERNIEFLINNNITNIQIVVGHLSEQFNYLVEKYGVKLIYNNLYKTTNNISSLVKSKDSFSNTLYLEGDIYLKKDIFPEIINKIKNNNFKSTMFGSKTSQNKSEWVFNIQDGEVLNHFLKENAKSEYIWTGIMFIDEKMGQEIKDKVEVFFATLSNRKSYFESFLWILKNKFIFSSINEKDFVELDNYDDLIKIDKSYLSHQSKNLFTPGPTNIIPELEEIVAKGLVHHRSKLYEYYLKLLVSKLRYIFGTTKGLPIVMSNSTTGAMEATIANLISEQDPVLLINVGGFGERFNELLNIYNAKVTNLNYKDGECYSLEEVSKHLKEKEYKAVFLTLLETSTGVLQDLKSLAKEMKKYKKTLFIVDTVSAVTEVDIDFDKNGIDVAYAATAKSFGLPPGLCAVALSPKAQKITYQTNNKRYYFDFRKYIEYYKNYKQSPFTPSVNLVVAWIYSIEIMMNMSFEKIREKKEVIYGYLYAEFSKLGCKPFIKKENKINSLLVMLVPNNIDANKIKEEIAVNSDFYFEVGRGEMASSIIRVGISITTTLNDAKNFIEEINKIWKMK